LARFKPQKSLSFAVEASCIKNDGLCDSLSSPGVTGYEHMAIEALTSQGKAPNGVAPLGSFTEGIAKALQRPPYAEHDENSTAHHCAVRAGIPIAGGRKCMKKKAVRRRVAARCTLFSIALFTLVFAQVQAMAAELAGNVDGASQAETSQTTQPATTSAEDLAKKLQNPVAALISVPFQSNFDFGLGPSHTGWRYTLNMQPVIPISLTKDWNLISRTILPVISQHNAVGAPIEAGGDELEVIPSRSRAPVDVNQDGLGGTVQSFSFLQSSRDRAELFGDSVPYFFCPLPPKICSVLGNGAQGLQQSY
jgi:hypothetical protein